MKLKIHPYLIVQAFYQHITPNNKLVANAGVVYDVSDAGELLENQLDGNGNDFTNEVFIFLGGFGAETTLNGKLTLSVEYIAMKHIEYRLKGNEWMKVMFIGW